MQVNNFSEGGMGISSNEYVPEGVRVELELVGPGEKNPIIIAGEIAWIDEAGTGDKQYKLGIELEKKERGKIFNFMHGKWLKKKKTVEV